MNKEQDNENKINKAWFEKDIEEWDENDEQEAFLNLIIGPSQEQK